MRALTENEIKELDWDETRKIGDMVSVNVVNGEVYITDNPDFPRLQKDHAELIPRYKAEHILFELGYVTVQKSVVHYDDDGEEIGSEYIGKPFLRFEPKKVKSHKKFINNLVNETWDRLTK